MKYLVKRENIWLLDGCALTALIVDTHIHHAAAERWFSGHSDAAFASCFVTEGTFLRMHMQLAGDKRAAAAWEALRAWYADSGHVFWDEGFSYCDVASKKLTGHGQVTDAWLAELARRKKARVATLDKGFAALHSDVATLIL